MKSGQAKPPDPNGEEPSWLDPADLPDTVLLDGAYQGPVRIRGPLRRLLIWTLPAYAGVFIVGSAISTLLLGLQVYDLDPEQKVPNLALIVTVGAIISLVGQPLGGLLSDRTRSRFGRRTPWLVGGAILGGLGIVLMGLQSSVIGMAICWGISHLGYTLASGPLTAVMPDRVPHLARGSFAAATGLGAVFAGIIGSFLGSAFRDAIFTGYVVITSLVVVSVVLFCIFNRDPSTADMPLEPLHARDLLQLFWISPLKHPDFFWTFLGRLLLYTGYGMVQGYTLYLLSDYIGLGREGAATFAPWLTFAAIPTGLVALLVGGPLSDRIGRRKPFVFAASLFIGIGLAVPFAWPTPAGMIIMTVILGLGFGLFQSVDTALVTEVLPSSASYAKDLGIVNIASSLPGTIAPGIAGAIIGVGGYEALFPVGIVLAVIGSFAVMPITSVR